MGELRLGMNEANFNSFLAETRATAFDERGLTVAVPNPLVRETLEQRFRPAIQRALFDVVGQQCAVRLVSGGSRGPESAERFGLFGIEAEDPPAKTDANGHHSRAATRDAGQHAGRSSAQLNARYTFERFVVGSSNRLAHAASEAVADAPGQAYNPLFLYGGVGLGKTHLLHAIGHNVLARGLSVVYVSSETFTNDLIEAIRVHRTDDFRTRYRRADVLMIDDIQFIASKERTQEEFFHTFNAIHESGGQIVLTSDRTPKAIPTLADRLRSRFEMGLIADLQAPDLETRIAILRSKLNGRGPAPPAVLELIAHKVQSNIRELEGSLNRVLAFASLHRRELSVELVAEALQDLLAAPPRTSRGPEAILMAVSQFSGVVLAELLGRSRTQKVVGPRHLAMYILREDAGLSLPQIGALMGGRDHTSVMHACEKLTREIERDGPARNDVQAVRELLR